MIPATQGLLPEPHNSKVMTLLFRLTEWHALAKLQMHTEHTLNALNQSTVAIGQELRSFQAWTRGFKTVELPREKEAREHCSRKKAASKTSAQTGPFCQQPQNPPTQDAALSHMQQDDGNEPTTKFFNLLTYKLHALGDYVQTIQQFGTTDSYSTQIVSSQVIC